MPPNLPQNQVSLMIDGFYTSDLVDTGTSVSVISLSLCKRLRKVLLPPQEPSLQSAFNRISTPMASVTARLFLNGTCYPFEFRVISESSHDIILGCDLLMENEALIDYIHDELLLTVSPVYDVIASGTPDKLPVELDTLLPPQSTSFVSLFVDSLPVSEVLLEPRKDALAKKGLLAPSCVVCVDNSRVFLPITNLLVGPVMLPAGFVAAFLGMTTYPKIIATLDPTSPGTPSHSEARI